MLHVLGRVLAKQGNQVTEARTGKEAIEKITAKAFHLAIIDINLPDINGLKLHKILSERSPGTKKLLLTGLPPEKDDIDNLAGEPVRILIKPLPAQELIAEIKQILMEEKTFGKEKKA